jgi:hypothetical protein
MVTNFNWCSNLELCHYVRGLNWRNRRTRFIQFAPAQDLRAEWTWRGASRSAPQWAELQAGRSTRGPRSRRVRAHRGLGHRGVGVRSPSNNRRPVHTARTAFFRVGREDFPIFYFCQVSLSNCWSSFFLVLTDIYICQVILPKCWRYSVHLLFVGLMVDPHCSHMLILFWLKYILKGHLFLILTLRLLFAVYFYQTYEWRTFLASFLPDLWMKNTF